MEVGQWTAGDLNSAPPVCRTGALPDELAAQVGTPGQGVPAMAGRRGRTAIRPVPQPAAYLVFTLLSCHMASTFTRGWCWQGRHESNVHSAGFGGRPPIRWVIPSAKDRWT